MGDVSSDASDDSVIYISSGEEDQSGERESDFSSDTEELVARIEKEVVTSPMLIGGRVMTTGSIEKEMVAGPSTSLSRPLVTPNFKATFFDEKLCHAPPKEMGRGK